MTYGYELAMANSVSVKENSSFIRNQSKETLQATPWDLLIICS
jgi:hypothetical protein